MEVSPKKHMGTTNAADRINVKKSIAPLQPFNWDQNGQDWGENEKYPLCRDGCKQSPIDIDFGASQTSKHLKILMSGYRDIPTSSQI